MLRPSLRFFSLALVGSVVACGGTEPEVSAPTTLSVSPTSVSMSSLGATQQLTATVLDQSGITMPDAAVQWSSSNELVISVSDGLVTAIGNGSASVTARSASAQSDVSVIVEQVAASISIAPEDLAFASLGDTASLSVAIQDSLGSAMAPSAASWTTGDAATAGVSSSGLVTARGNGTTLIQVQSGPVADTTTVTVQQVAVRLAVTPTTDTLRLWGDTARFVATAFDAHDSVYAGAPIAWESADQDIFQIQADGLWNAVANGVTSAVASTSAGSGSVSDTAEVVVFANHGVSRWVGPETPWADPASWYLGRVPTEVDSVSIETSGGSDVVFDLAIDTIRNLVVGTISPDTQRVTINGELWLKGVPPMSESRFGPTAHVELVSGLLARTSISEQMVTVGTFIWSGGSLGTVLITPRGAGRTFLRPGGGDLVLAAGGALTIDETDTAARWEGDGRLVFTDSFNNGLSLQNFVVAGQMNAVWEGAGSSSGIPIQSGGLSGSVSFDFEAAANAQMSVSDLNISLDAFVSVLGVGAMPPGTTLDLVLLSGSSVFSGSPVSGTAGWQLLVNPEVGVGLRAVKQ